MYMFEQVETNVTLPFICRIVFWGNMKEYLHFPSSIHIQMAQALEILPRDKNSFF